MKKKNTILVVDDMPVNRAILSEIFRKDFHVLCAEDGTVALDLIDKHFDNIAIVLLDVIMPIMDGFEVVEKMSAKSYLEKIPVVLITAEDPVNYESKGYDIGVSDIIGKPINPGVVRRRVQNIIDLYHHKNNLEEIVETQTRKIEEQAERLRETNSLVIETLSTIVEFRNMESGQHIRRVSRITRHLLNELASRYEEYKLTPSTIEAIVSAAAVHDIGKIVIPDSVLLKHGRLTSEEFDIMKTHSIRGCEILKNLDYIEDKEFLGHCFDICRHHHERWNGVGYPDGLAGDEIPISAQVVSIADVYDALTSERVYKPAYSSKIAADMILGGECGVFSPKLIECFKHLLAHIDDNDEIEQISVESAPFETFMFNTEEQTEAEWSLQCEKEKFDFISSITNQVIFDYDIYNDTIVFSPKFSDLFDVYPILDSFHAFIESSDWVNIDDKKIALNWFSELTATPRHIELRLKSVSCKYKWFSFCAKYITSLDHKQHLIGKITDICEQKYDNERLRNLSHLDSLTGLLTMNTARAQVNQAISKSGSYGTIFFIDIDNLCRINEAFGYFCGDEIIVYLSNIIKNIASDSNGIIARVGGDEFMIYIKNQNDEKYIMDIVNILLNDFAKSFNYTNSKSPIPISLSIGISSASKYSDGYDTILSQAISALYSARCSKEHYAFFNPSIPVKRNPRSSIKITSTYQEVTDIPITVFNMLYHCNDVEAGIHLTLQMLLNKYSLDAIYIMQFDISCKLDCQFYSCKTDSIIIPPNQLSPQLESDGIEYLTVYNQSPFAHSILRCKILSGCSDFGYISFEDYHSGRTWTNEESASLLCASKIIGMFLSKTS